MEPQPGTLYGRYRLEERIGGGGFGEVWRAEDPVLNRAVAIKILRPAAEGDDGGHRLSLREARAASALNHPSIVTIHDIGEAGGRAFIVMEWIDGVTLRAIVRGGPIDPRRAAAIARQVAAALARAHAAGIVHRDLKPENVMVRADDVAKILDFGLARRAGEGAVSLQATETDRLAGTPAYMAPEQLRGEPADGASDLFALGVMLYEMTTGRHPFAAGAPYATMQRILNADPDPPGTLAALPAGWNDLILALLAKGRGARPAGAAEVAAFLEGGGAAIEAARPVATDGAGRAAHLVGRGRELRALRQRWDDLAARGGGFVLLAAEPGAGKTTVVQSFLRGLAAAGGAMTATGRCSERLGSGEPYLPFLEALAELAASPRGALVRAVLKGKAPTWYLQLFPSAGDDSAYEQVRRELAGGSQERMRREMVDALEEITRADPLCLALEDLHWSDLATTELFAYLAKRIPAMRLMILGTFRPSELVASSHPLRPILLEMQGRGAAVEMALEFLGEADVRAYVDLEFPAHRLPPEFSQWVYRKTEGSPLFMADLLRYLVEREAIVAAPHWHLTRPIDTLEGEVPASVRSMIEKKIEALGEEQRQVLSAAAVQGETFDSLTLSEIAGLDELRLEEILETLRRAHRLVAPVGESEFPDGALTVRHKFIHVLYQNTLYQALTAKRRVLLHARIGEALARRHGARPHGAAPELALHFDRARLHERALPFYLAAAENAVSKFAHVQAEAYCTRALELAERLDPSARDRERIPILRTRGQVRFVMSRFDEAAADFQEMLQSAERAGDTAAQAAALCHLAEASFWAKNNEGLEAQVDRVLALASAHDLPGAAAQGHLLLSLQRTCYGRLAEAGGHLDQAEERARAASLTPVLARTLAWRSMLWFYRGDYERVLANSKRVEALGLESHDAFTIMVSHFHTGLSHANAGNLAEAQRVLENGRRMSERNNDLFWLGRYPNCVAWLHHEGFEFESALERNQEAAAIARQTGFLEGEANSIINVGLAAVELGDLDRARAAFEESEEVFKRDDWFKWRYRMRLEVGWSELYLRRGDLATARAHAEAIRALAQGSGAKKYLALALRQVGRIDLLEGKVAEAEATLQAAVRESGDLRAPLAAWRVYRALGDLYRETGRREPARTCDGTALRILKDLAERAPAPLDASILASRTVRELERLVAGA